MSDLVINFTTPHYHNMADAIVLGQAWQFDNARITIPKKGWRTCEFEVSIFNEVVKDIRQGLGPPSPLKILAHVTYRGEPVFWGPVEGLDAGTEPNTIRFSAKDSGHYLEHNYVRRGDIVLDPPYRTATDKASVPLDHRALPLLMDGAEPPSDGYPVLGIYTGFNDDPDETRTYGIERGQLISQLWLDIGVNTLGPDWRLRPLHIQDGIINQHYVHLETFATMLNDRADELVFEAGAGMDNAHITWTPGGKVVTHVHVIYNKKKARVTRHNSATAAQYGVHVDWLALDADNITDEIAKGYADGQLEAYADPANLFVVKPKRPDELNGRTPALYYMEHFDVGDTCLVHAKKGWLLTPDIVGQIREVQLVGNSKECHAELTCAPLAGDFEDTEA